MSDQTTPTLTTPTQLPLDVRWDEFELDFAAASAGKVPIRRRVAPAPEPPPPIVGFPRRRASDLYYQHHDAAVELWEAGTQPPADGSLFVAVANSIDGKNDYPNTPTAGIDWAKDPFGNTALHFWWAHVYGSSAGARAVFSRDGWKPLLPAAILGQRLYALIDFVAPAIPVMTGGGGLWCTWPFQWKGHDPYAQATIQANIDSDDRLWWGTAYKNVEMALMEPTQLFPGALHRLMFEINPVYDHSIGYFKARLDGKPVVHAVGQMAFPPNGAWGETATFCPCLYGNAMQTPMEGFIPSMILSTEPIQAADVPEALP